MKRSKLNAVTLGLAWMASLGVVFILGILSAFAFHLGPGAGSEDQADLSLEQRELILVLERYAGKPVDVAAILAYPGTEAMPEQLDQGLRAILRENDPERRLLAAMRLADGLPPRRVMGCIRFLQAIPPDMARDQVLRRFIESWARTDGRSAIGFATSLEAPRESQLAISAALRGWSQSRPSEAWNWVIERAGNSRRAERWLEVIFANLGSSDREAALALLEKMPSRDFQTKMSLVVMEQILEAEPPREALSWLGALPAGTASAAAGLLAGQWAATEPAAAADWLHETFPYALDGFTTVLEEWVYVDPVAAADWVWQSFTGADRRDLIDFLAEEWLANYGPTPLAEWLNSRGADPSLDGAIEALALATASLDPATALVWAQSIMDPSARSMMEIRIGRQWIELSPAEAEENLPLLLDSESARAALLEPVYEDIEDTRIDEAGLPMEAPLTEDQ